MNQDRTLIIAFGIFAFALLFGGFAILTNRPAPVEIVLIPPIPTSTPAPPAPITVYITGAVHTPQTMIELPAGSRIQDAIDSVGGLLDDADLDRINLAAILRDGDQIHVFSHTDEQVVLAIPTANSAGAVLINSATADELITLPGIGPALAERIITYREENGRFTSFDDLNNVSGIGDTLIERLQGLIEFDS